MKASILIGLADVHMSQGTFVSVTRQMKLALTAADDVEGVPNYKESAGTAADAATTVVPDVSTATAPNATAAGATTTADSSNNGKPRRYSFGVLFGGASDPFSSTKTANTSSNHQTKSKRNLTSTSASNLTSTPKIGGPVHAEVWSLRAHSERLKGKWDKAFNILKAVLESRRDAFGPSHPKIADTYIAMAEVELLRGNFESAAELIELSMEMLAKYFPMPESESESESVVATGKENGENKENKKADGKVEKFTNQNKLEYHPVVFDAMYLKGKLASAVGYYRASREIMSTTLENRYYYLLHLKHSPIV
jgi:hypothetical protein